MIVETIGQKERGRIGVSLWCGEGVVQGYMRGAGGKSVFIIWWEWMGEWAPNQLNIAVTIGHHKHVR